MFGTAPLNLTREARKQVILDKYRTQQAQWRQKPPATATSTRKRKEPIRKHFCPPLRKLTITNLLGIPEISSTLLLQLHNKCYSHSCMLWVQTKTATTVRDLYQRIITLVKQPWVNVYNNQGCLLDGMDQPLEDCYTTRFYYQCRPLKIKIKANKRKIIIHPRIAALPPLEKAIMLRRLQLFQQRSQSPARPRKENDFCFRFGEPEPPPAPYYNPLSMGPDLDIQAVFEVLQ